LLDDPDLSGARRVDRRIPVRLLNFAWHRLEWPPADRLAHGTFDVAHSMHPLLMPARTAAQVVTIHDLDFVDHPERTRAEIRRDYPALAAAHASRADRVVVVSEFTAGEVRRLLEVPAERISVCSPGRPDWPARNGEPADGYLLFVGTLEPRKNVGTLLDAYEALVTRRPELPQLVLAGRASTESSAWLARIDRAPLRGRVRHLGYVDAAERYGIYAGARLLVQPSLAEGFGLPVLEAMTVGVPVVAANAGALPEVAAGAALLFDPANAEALAGTIDQMLDDSAQRERCIRTGLARSQAYSWVRTAAETVRAWEHAVAHRRRTRGAA
jgi:alpha-1,3-rhamnosyl/mannosyltransferase